MNVMVVSGLILFCVLGTSLRGDKVKKKRWSQDFKRSDHLHTVISKGGYSYQA